MTNASTTAAPKWRSIIGLIFIYVAVWFNWQWAWAILFLLWVIPDLMSGVTYFMEPVEKQKNPILYWLIMASWILMSLYYLAIIFFPDWKYYQ